MKIHRPKHTDSMNDFEKTHTPSIEVLAEEVIVTVGEIEHPMNPEHFITRIELLINGREEASKELNYDDKPSVTFKLGRPLFPDDRIAARAMCNIHGVWESV